MSKHSDTQLMTAIVAGGIGAVAGAMFMIAKAKSALPAPVNGLVNLDFQKRLGATIRFQPYRRDMNGVVYTEPQPIHRSLRGWGTPGFGRAGTGAAVFWRQVA